MAQTENFMSGAIPEPRTAAASPPALTTANMYDAQSQDDSPISVLPQLWPHLAQRYGDSLALLDPHASPPVQYSFQELANEIATFAAGLSALPVQGGGLSPGERVSLFSENGARWLVADQGVMSCGAVDAVRGSSSSAEELLYIAEHSNSVGIIVQDYDTLQKLKKGILQSQRLCETLRFVIVLWPKKVDSRVNSPETLASQAEDEINGLYFPVFSFEQVLEYGKMTGERELSDFEFWKYARHPSDGLATLVYTSGTTGQPKGVALTHRNILYQVEQFPQFLNVLPGQQTLSLLPPWHIYERSCAYFILSRGAAMVYTSVRKFRDDLTVYPPNHLVCVPLVLQSLHSRVMAMLRKAPFFRRTLALGLLAAAINFCRAKRVVDGVDILWARTPRPLTALVVAWCRLIMLAPLNWLAQKLVAAKIRSGLGIKGGIVSGGGSLPPYLDDFYEAVGFQVLNGWGLTETSPVLACRSACFPHGNIRGTVGRVIKGGTEVRVIDPQTLKDVPDGEQGLLLARGPGVMGGYDGAEAATAAAFPLGDGWFNTGDLGWRAPNGVAGSRMGGCIVLTGRAKDTIVLSSGENVEPQPIEDSLCQSPLIKFAILIGHGHRSIGALIFPDFEGVEEASGLKDVKEDEIAAMLKPAVTAAGDGRPIWEHVAAFTVLPRSSQLSIDDGTLTRTMKPRRLEIMNKYRKEVEWLEQRLR